VLFFLGLLAFSLDLLAIRLAPPWLNFRIIIAGVLAATVLELTAVGFGLAAQRTATGIWGLRLSLVALTLLAGVCCCLLSVLVLGSRMTGVDG
jgi:hypothetical protein